MNTSQLGTLRELSEIEIDQVVGGGGCDPGDRTQWVHKQGDPSWLYRDCCGVAHNIHRP